MTGNDETEEKALESRKHAGSVTEGPRKATGVPRTNNADPTAGFETASHARIEQSFC